MSLSVGLDDSPLTERYTYDPLSKPTSFRLLNILPERHQGLIQIKMRDEDTGTRPFYRCLSYIWGENTTTQDILVNSRLLGVRQNLHDFLALAATRKVRTSLWMDTICIDQEDLDERAQQVQNMGDIYGSAHQVIIWLNRTIDLGPLHRYSELDWWEVDEGVIATCKEVGSNMY